MAHVSYCIQCGDPMVVRNKRRIFCEDKCKVRYHREHGLTCWYCGEVADTRDHLVPHSVTNDVVRKWAGRDWVSCCVDCNGLMRSEFPFEIERRVGFLIDCFVRRHRLDRVEIEWDRDELMELRGSLRRYIRGKQVERSVLERRLVHMRLRFVQLCNRLDESSEV